MQLLKRANTFIDYADVTHKLHTMYKNAIDNGYKYTLEVYIPSIKYTRNHWYKDENEAKEVSLKMGSRKVKVIGVYTIQSRIDNLYS